MPAYDSLPIRDGERPTRSFSFTNLPVVRQLVDLVCDYEKKPQQLEEGEDLSAAAMPMMRRQWSVEDFAKISDGEHLGRCPYSSVVKNPVPYEFRMPVHYPRFSKEQYETMPEWQMDRLLEEYGLPASAMGSIEEKRQYAVGAFLWRDQKN